MKRRCPYWIFLAFYVFLTVLLTYPLVLYLPTYVADTGDPLLNTWALAWGQHALRLPWHSVGDLFDTNAFYPYPQSLGFSEHLLPYAALTLPLLALKLGPIFSHNAAILFSLALAGWGMALLVTHWTGNRWAGLVAGVTFAFLPARLNHWAHLHQLSIQWLPFIILSLDLWLARKQWRDAALLGLFLNLQLLSAVNYIPQTIMLVGLYALVHGTWCVLRIAYQKGRERIAQHATRTTQHATRNTQHVLRIALGGLILGAITLSVNWPITKVYFDLSEDHGFERNLGDASIYGAALVDYVTPPPENLLYGSWLTPRLADPARPLIPLFIGFVPMVLAVIGAGTSGVVLVRQLRSRAGPPPRNSRQSGAAGFLLLLILAAILLSFGANEAALGRDLAPLTRHVLFYRWLFEHVPGFSGLRVPARAAILAFFGLAALAGLGVATLQNVQNAAWVKRTRHNTRQVAPTVLILFITVEYLALPLHGTRMPANEAIPPVYQYLAAEPEGKVVLELPYDLAENGPGELPRLYYSSYGWYKLVNGASGFNPRGLLDLSAQVQRFPDAASLDVLRQMGVTHLVLHSAEFSPDRWRDIWSRLPGFLPSVASVAQFGDDFLLSLRPPACASPAGDIVLQPQQVDGQLALSFHNQGPAAYVTNPRATSRVQTGQLSRRFIEPLFIPAGETRTLEKLALLPKGFDGTISLDVASLAFHGTLPVRETTASPATRDGVVPSPQVPLDVRFGDAGPRLVGYTLFARAGAACRVVTLRLYWAADATSGAGTQSLVRLVDRFGQTIGLDTTYPWKNSSVSNGVLIDDHRLPIPQTTPAGQYGAALGVLSGSGTAYRPLVKANLIATEREVLLSDVLVRPAVPDAGALPAQPVGALANGITLLGYQVDKTQLAPGDWVRLTLFWRAGSALSDNLTVFTQFSGPSGRVWGQYDNPPGAGWYPTTLWQPGEVVSDDYLIHLNPATPAGELRLRVGLYHPDTLARIPVLDGADSLADDSILVTTLKVTAEGRGGTD
jgi:hypothetical protein